ncbi:MAG: glutamate formimidoyltransferase [Bacillota bacterium]
MRLVECVPNFSEGRDKRIIEQIARSLRVPGATLLDYSWDEDHNRSVMTVVGEAEAVAEAAFQGVRTAVSLIDMEGHRGDHPRMGAADVVPFVPVRGVTMEDCVGLAKSVGQRIAQELEVPVYLYGEAASTPERRSLGHVRRGQYEGLKEGIHLPERCPDYGPTRMHPSAGATAVGARMPLVAFNINLASADLDLAKRISRHIRTSSGGLPHIMATAVALRQRGEVQVSMNLTDPSVTSLHRAYQAVREEAEAAGVALSGSEIIGLVPLEVLLESLRHFLQAGDLSAAQVMEARLLEELMEVIPGEG